MTYPYAPPIRRLRLLAPLTALLLAAGCTVGPDYAAPDPEAPERFVAQEVLATLAADRDTSPTVARWWEGFEDPLLNDMVERALEQNLRISAAVARLRNARSAVDFEAAGDKPLLTTGPEPDYEHERELDSGEDSNPHSLVGVLGLAWQPDLFGRTQRRVQSARAGVETAEAELRALVLDVSTSVVQEYLTLCGDERQLVLLRESVDLQEQTLNIVRSRLDAGISPELDLRRAETSVERLRADIPPLEESLANAGNRLATLTGQFPGAWKDRLTARGRIPRYRARVADPLPLEVLTRRPDIQAAEARLKQAVAEIGVAEAEFYPTFDLASQISIGSSMAGGGPHVPVLIASLSGVLEQVIYDGGARQANLDGAEALAEAALHDYRQRLLEVSEEVETALNTIRALRKSEASLQKAVASSSRSFQQAETLYRQGLISFLDVLDAQRVLADLEQRLAVERTNDATQIANLFRVLGTPVDLAPIRETHPPMEWDPSENPDAPVR